MQDQVNCERMARSQLLQGLRDRAKTITPALSSVAGDEQLDLASVAQSRPSSGCDCPQGINAGVAGDEYAPRQVLGFQVGGANFGRGEEQVGAGVDGRAKFFLGPWHDWIEAPEPGLDMGYGNRSCKGGQRAGEGARRIALDDEQIGPVGKAGSHGPRNLRDMAMRVATAGTIQHDALITAQPVLVGAERMLAGQNQARRQGASAKRCGDRCKLDCFWTGSDNDVDTRTGQPSP